MASEEQMRPWVVSQWYDQTDQWVAYNEQGVRAVFFDKETADSTAACVNACDEAGVRNPGALARFIEAAKEQRKHDDGPSRNRFDAALAELEGREDE